MPNKINKHLALALVIVSVVLLFQNAGNWFSGTDAKVSEQNARFSEILNYISTFYVDEVEWDKSFESAINGMLSSLDPHSVYFDTEEAQQNEENFDGKYQGIGIQFDVIDRFLTVIAPIPGSPSEKTGLQAGDRIIKIDGTSAIGITSKEVQKRLKGPAGSEVEITVLRDGVDENLEFSIERDEIPLFTVNTYFVDQDATGYILLNRFARNTENEIESALSEMESDGMQRLILDLRWNGGGYLDQAVKLAARFLDGHKKIVYTKGRITDFNEEFFADSFGEIKHRKYPLIVLINHASASASEIVAGAIQDYDRGLIVGTTSFGKGLVQREFEMDDGSRLRLTISKYYTPSGRLIQRPYKNKDLATYFTELDDSSALKDTTAVRPEFHTGNGRVVYGGGGITPDIIVPADNLPKSGKLVGQLFQKRVFFEVATRFAREHKSWKKRDEWFLTNYHVSDQLLNELKRLAVEKKIEIDARAFTADADYLKRRLKSEIVRQLWDSSKYYRSLLEADGQYDLARRSFKNIDQELAKGADMTTGSVTEVQQK